VTNSELVTALDLDAWCKELSSQSRLPILVRQLILATAPVTEITMPAREGVLLRGWDGLVQCPVADAHVPLGLSGWELGTSHPPRDKAQRDIRNRTRNPQGVAPATTTFVAVTARIWPDRERWRDARRKTGRWADVRAYDAHDLELWMERAPSAHVRISEMLGREPRDVQTPDAWWETWSAQTDPALPLGFLLGGREGTSSALAHELAKPPQVITVVAASQTEALAVACASLVGGGDDVDGLRAKALIVSRPGAWGRLVDSDSPLVLMPTFEEPDVATALRCGHRVVVPVALDVRPRGALVDVPPLDRQRAAQALLAEHPALDRDRAERHAAHASRNLISFRRTIALSPQVKRPPWSRGPEGRRLAPLVLAGAWSADNEGDQRAIEQLTGRSHDDVEGDLAMWSAQDDVPLYRSGGTWRLVSRDDAWNLVHPLVTPTDLARFQTVAADVLREPDPALDVEPHRRFMAAVVGRPRTYSVRLRESLAETAAFLAGCVGDRPLKDRLTGKEHAYRLVSAVTEEVNTDATGRAWQSLADVMPLLAEAAPQVFLRAVEEGLRGDDPPVASLFMDSETASIFGVTSPHVRLLGALKVLCWSPEDFSRAAFVLARLAAIDREPDGRSRPRPAGCLADVFSLWAPRTSASVRLRLAVVDRLRGRIPDVAWSLMRAMIPTRFALAGPPHYPRWRDWPRTPPEEATPDPLAAAVAEVITRLIDDAGEDAGRWTDLVAHVDVPPFGDHDRVLDALEQLDPDSLDEPGRNGLWQALVDLGHDHRRFPEADWALPGEVVDRVEAVAGRFAPASAADRHADLFNSHPRFTDLSISDATGYDAAVRAVRRDAIREVLDGGGVPDLLAFGRAVTMPIALGWAAGEARSEALAADLLPLVGADGTDGCVAHGWAGARVQADGVGWIERHLEGAETWSTAQRAGLLLADPSPSLALLAIVGQQDEDVRALFWRRMSPFLAATDARPTVVRELTEHSRPWAAMTVLIAMLAVGTDESAMDVDLVVRTLERAAIGPCENAHQIANLTWAAGRLLDHLERVGSDIGTRARLEFFFLPALHFTRPARALRTALQTDPALFADLMSYAYRAEDDDPDEELTPQREAIASAGFMALRSWDTPPGVRPDGTVDADQLRGWVTEARRLLADSGRSTPGDAVIGSVLAHVPPDGDGVWPAAPLRDLVEDLESDPFESGLRSGKINSRGMMTWSPADGGAHDRALAAQFREWADRVADQPRTAALLRQLAEGDEAWARREDDRSQEFIDRDP
jgi:hypothetical protein